MCYICMNISLQIVVEWMWKVADFNHSKCTSSISIVPKIKHICQSPVRLTLVYQISLWYLRSWLPPAGSAESETWLKLLTDLLQFKGRPRGHKSNSWNVQESVSESSVVDAPQRQNSRWLPLLPDYERRMKVRKSRKRVSQKFG